MKVGTATWQCSFCNIAAFSNAERLDHEGVCTRRSFKETFREKTRRQNGAFTVSRSLAPEVGWLMLSGGNAGRRYFLLIHEPEATAIANHWGKDEIPRRAQEAVYENPSSRYFVFGGTFFQPAEEKPEWPNWDWVST